MNIRKIPLLILLLSLLTALFSCSGDEPDSPPPPPADNQQTVIMFFPWSTNLLPYFRRNIADFGSTVESRGLSSERVIVCLATAPDRALLLEMRNVKGKCVTDTLESFSGRTFTSRTDIAGLLSTITAIAPAERYGMIIGCHGMGWLPVNRDRGARQAQRLHYEIESPLPTRYFGGLSPDTQIEIADLAGAISDAGLRMEYILFDDCYMSSVEAAYTLRHATDHIIACPTEVLAYGFPYHKCGQYLLGTVDYAGVIDAFHQFYSTNLDPYGTAAVTDCRQLDALADIVRRIHHTASQATPADIQVMDGYSPSIFFDLSDYIAHICTDPQLLDQFAAQMQKTVPYSSHTKNYYCAAKGVMPIRTFCGITTSAPSLNPLTSSVTSTAWHIATH